jgi:hypothetical protein
MIVDKINARNFLITSLKGQIKYLLSLNLDFEISKKYGKIATLKDYLTAFIFRLVVSEMFF